MFDLGKVKERFFNCVKSGEFATIRIVSSYSESIAVRSDVLAPVSFGNDSGYMITVYSGDGSGYASSGDFSEKGIKKAMNQLRPGQNSTAGTVFFHFQRLKNLIQTANIQVLFLSHGKRKSFLKRSNILKF